MGNIIYIPKPKQLEPRWNLLAEYDTNKNGTVNMSITADAGEFKWVFNGVEYIGTSFSVSNNGVQNTAQLWGFGTCEITGLDLGSENIVGHAYINHSAFNTIKNINIEYNAGLTGWTMPSTTGPMTNFNFRRCDGITGTVDLSFLTNLDGTVGCDIDIGALGYSAITFPTTYTGKVNTLRHSWTHTAFTRIWDFSVFTSWTDNAILNIAGTANSTDIIMPTSVTGIFDQVSISNVNTQQTTIDVSMFTRFNATSHFTVQQLPARKIVLFPAVTQGTFNYLTFTDLANTSVDLSSCTLESITGGYAQFIMSGSYIATYSFPSVVPGTITGWLQLSLGSQFKGILDLSRFNAFTNSAYVTIMGTGLTGITFAPGTTGKFHELRISYCYNVMNLSLANLPADAFDYNNSYLHIYYCQLTDPAEVNQLLVEADNRSTSGYTGRDCNIYAGTTVAPDSSSGGYDGLAAKASLEAKGFTVVTTT